MELITKKEKKVLDALIVKHRKDGVLGYSNIKHDGKIRIYVSSEDVTPHVLAFCTAKGIDNIEIVVIGEVKALGSFFPITSTTPEKTKKIRPLVIGTSVGHKNITAGTIGLFVKDEYGNECILSNAHVLHPNPLSSYLPVDKTICQPGPYDFNFDMSKVDEYRVGQLLKHIPLIGMYSGSQCNLAIFIEKMLNVIAKAFRRRTRFIAVAQVPNYADAAIAKIDEGIKYIPDKTFSCKISANTHKWIGLLFAGSSNGKYAVMCKAKYIIEGLRITPIAFEVLHDLKIGMIVEKDGRSSCYTKGRLIDVSASITVSYGIDNVWFDDVCIVEAIDNVMCLPGDSGSSMFVRI
ncbi:hypothetical protein DRJ17_04025 [Candidatus Woesearchaeota archaeon]|nr:MAG: hypothetical protein DRJ17_04025 [Candidatus Woesearchaeota archaeon]